MASRLRSRAQAVGVNWLVRQRQHVEQSVEMADRGVDVDRLDRVAGPEMDDVEGLSEADEVLVVAMIPRPAAAGAVGRIGRAPHRAEGDVAAADGEAAGGIARMQGEFSRREPDLRLDQRGRKAHALRGRIDIGAGVLQHRTRPVVQEVHADLLEHCERGAVDRLQLVRRNEIERREGQARLRRRPARRGWRRALAAPSLPAPLLLRLCVSGHGAAPLSLAGRGSRRGMAAPSTGTPSSGASRCLLQEGERRAPVLQSRSVRLRSCPAR